MMEHVRFGNLARAWRDKDEDMWSVMEITRILYQCLHAFEYLHAKPIVVHRDINPRSIMIQDRYPSPRIKIGNFGNAKEGMKANGKVGSWTYAAPEVFSGMFNCHKFAPMAGQIWWPEIISHRPRHLVHHAPSQECKLTLMFCRRLPHSSS